jgi:hypothetical protein
MKQLQLFIRAAATLALLYAGVPFHSERASAGFAIHRWILCIRSKRSRRDCRYRVHTLILDVPNDREEYVHVSRAFSAAGVSTGDVVG